jgi:cell division protein FtsL
MKRSRSVAALIILTMLLLYVTERIGVVKVGYDIERLKAQKAKLERDRDEMRVKLSSLTAPERIAKVATERLAMAPPKPGQVVLVQVGSETVPTGIAMAPEVKLAKYEPGGRLP